jgi:hypothetical protein
MWKINFFYLSRDGIGASGYSAVFVLNLGFRYGMRGRLDNRSALRPRKRSLLRIEVESRSEQQKV